MFLEGVPTLHSADGIGKLPSLGLLRGRHAVDSNMPGFLLVRHTWQGLSRIHYSDKSASCLAKKAPAERVKISMKMFCGYLEFAVMVHSWRVVVLGRQSQFPFAKIFLAVGVREFVPSICGQRQSKISLIAVNNVTFAKFDEDITVTSGSWLMRAVTLSSLTTPKGDIIGLCFLSFIFTPFGSHFANLVVFVLCTDLVFPAVVFGTVSELDRHCQLKDKLMNCALYCSLNHSSD